MLNNVIKVIVVSILFMLTILLFNTINQYEIAGDELLVSGRFGENLDNWEKVGNVVTVLDGSQTVVQLKSENNKKIVSIKQVLKNVQKGQKVRLVGAMKTQSVDTGDKAWKAARIIFVAVDAAGQPMYNVPHILVARNGTTDWQYYSKEFVAISHAAGYYIEIQLVNVTGVAWVKNFSFRPVKEASFFRLFQSVVALLWVVVTLWLLVPYWRSIFSSKWNLLIIAIMLVAFFGALLPVDLKHSTLEFLKLKFPWVIDDEAFFLSGHFLVYSMLSIIVFWKAESGRQIITYFGLLIVFAMATEISQFMVDGRTPRISDFFVDTFGMIFGLFISRIFLLCNKVYTKRGVG